MPSAGPANASPIGRPGTATAAQAPSRATSSPSGLRPATEPPEDRGLERDAVALLTSGARGDDLARVRDLPRFLRPGDLLVANRSAVRRAALPAWADEGAWSEEGGRPADGGFLVHLAHHYGGDLWLVEPRYDAGRTGPLPLLDGAPLRIGGLPARLLEAFPGVDRLRFARIRGDVHGTSRRVGRPIRYGYLRARPDETAYATVFGDLPGSAEMASAGRPFTRRLLAELEAREVGLARITLHAGVSGLDAPEDDADLVVPPERFEVDAPAAARVNAALKEGRRVIAIGTGAVRALESAWDGGRIIARSGWTRRVLRPGASGGFLSGLITGLHEPEASHLRLLDAVIGRGTVRRAYDAAVRADLAAHEFGDLQLLWREDGSRTGAAGVSFDDP